MEYFSLFNTSNLHNLVKAANGLCGCTSCMPIDIENRSVLSSIESNGSVELLADSSNNRVSVFQNGSTISVKFNNRQITTNQFADREILAAETINGENRILWRETSTGRIRTWLLDRNWNFVNNDNPLVDPNSASGRTLQQQFFMIEEPPVVPSPIPQENNISLKASLPLDRTFLLHSNPTATKTIFLDFDGHFVQNSPWENGGNLQVGGFYSTINDTARAEIQKIWTRVAEDFAPFDINVTTQDPGSEALRKSGVDDERWGIRVAFTSNRNLITGQAIRNAGGGGTAYYNSFNWATDDVALVFNRGAYTAAETASHEIGHTLGLSHDGQGTLTEYYSGHGTGSTSWASIMGAAWLGNDEVVTQWSRGEYRSANNTEDDLAIITTGNGFGYRADDHGNTINDATDLHRSAFGIIERNTDVDMFRFTTQAGRVTFNISNAVRTYVNNNNQFDAHYLTTQGPNLDIAASLYDQSGNLIQTYNPQNETSVSFTTDLITGTYYLKIDGVGTGNPMGSTPSGYTDYGSIGQYVITTNVSQTPPPPPVLTNVIESNGSVTLLNNNNLISVRVNGVTTTVKYQNRQITANQFDDRRILAAERINGENRILWEEVSTGRIRTWLLNSSWNFVNNNNPLVDPNSPQGISLLNQFFPPTPAAMDPITGLAQASQAPIDFAPAAWYSSIEQINTTVPINGIASMEAPLPINDSTSLTSLIMSSEFPSVPNLI